jgi:hypothetical protein
MQFRQPGSCFKFSRCISLLMISRKWFCYRWNGTCLWSHASFPQHSYSLSLLFFVSLFSACLMWYWCRVSVFSGERKREACDSDTAYKLGSVQVISTQLHEKHFYGSSFKWGIKINITSYQAPHSKELYLLKCMRQNGPEALIRFNTNIVVHFYSFSFPPPP